MLRNILSVAFVLSIFAGSASAQTCGTGIPNNLTNGSIADATQVMANLNYLNNCINTLRGYLGGLTMSNDSASPNTFIDTSVGVADSDDAMTMMTLGTAFTKNATAAWAAGTGNGCLDTGTFQASMWYHLFIIANTTTGAVDELCSTSATGPTRPSGYNKQRRIGSFKTDASSHILAFTQSGGQFLWKNAVADVNNAPISSTTATYPVISVPPGVSVTAVTNIGVDNSSGGAGMIVWTYAPTTIMTPTFYTVVSTVASTPAVVPLNIQVLSTGGAKIAAEVYNANCSYWVITLGWIDPRGRFN